MTIARLEAHGANLPSRIAHSRVANRFIRLSEHKQLETKVSGGPWYLHREHPSPAGFQFIYSVSALIVP